MAATLSALAGLGSVTAAGAEERGAANTPAVASGLGAEDPGTERAPTRWRVTAATGLDYSRGDFGTESSTTVWTLPTSLEIELESFFVKATVPYLVIEGEAPIVGGVPVGGFAGGVVDTEIPGSPGSPGSPTTSAESSSSRRTGLGDVELSAGYTYLPTLRGLPGVQLSGGVKLATADEDEGLGTGEEDYTVDLDVWKKLGPFLPFASVGYRFIGEPPDSSLRDTLLASAGLSIDLGSRIDLGVAYDWAESSVPDRPARQEITPFASIRIGRHLSVDPYSVVGLSSSSVDWGSGVQIRFLWGWDPAQ